MNFLSSIIIIFFLFSSAIVQAAEPANKLQVLADDYLKEYHDAEHISAVTLTVATAENMDTIYSAYNDFAQAQSINSQNLYQIGSITKSFIAAVILQLEATPELHFSIDDQLSKYLPQYSAWGNVTVRQLLNMTSGIPDFLSQDTYLQDLANNPYKNWLPEEELNYVAKKPLQFLPGTNWDYSNTNYILAGMIVSKLTGHSVEDEINLRFLSSNNSSHLQLHNTYYVTDRYPSGVLSRMVHGYHFGGGIGKYVPSKYDVTNFSLSYAGAAGAIVSNPENITLWVHALFTKDKILPEKQLKELTTLVSTKTGQPLVKPDENDSNGFGLGIGMSYVGDDIPGDILISYDGMTMGYRSQYIYIPSQDLVIAAVTNSSVDQDNNHLMGLVVNAYVAITPAKTISIHK